MTLHYPSIFSCLVTTSLICHLDPSLDGDKMGQACIGWAGIDFDSVGAVWVLGNETLLLASAATLTMMCCLERSVIELEYQELGD